MTRSNADIGREDAYGREAIDTLVKCIEDYRGQLAVVLAGYSDEMEVFLNVNPGMRSRIARVLGFPDYSDSELLAIAENVARTDGGGSPFGGKLGTGLFSERPTAVDAARAGPLVESVE